jgi:hypothetical protein
MIHHSDNMGAKGVGLVRIDISSMLPAPYSSSDKQSVIIDGSPFSPSSSPNTIVDIFVTHLHANYSNHYSNYSKSYLSPDTHLHKTSDIYLAHRIAQAYELARYIASMRDPHHLCLLAGDINAPPYDICVHIIQKVGNLHDSFAACNPGKAGYTCGARDNTFFARMHQEADELKHMLKQKLASNPTVSDESSPKLHSDELDESNHTLTEFDHGYFPLTPKRIDYIFFSLPTDISHFPGAPRWRLARSSVVKMFVNIKGEQFSFSDHWGELHLLRIYCRSITRCHKWNPILFAAFHIIFISKS